MLCPQPLHIYCYHPGNTAAAYILRLISVIILGVTARNEFRMASSQAKRKMSNLTWDLLVMRQLFLPQSE